MRAKHHAIGWGIRAVRLSSAAALVFSLAACVDVRVGSGGGSARSPQSAGASSRRTAGAPPPVAEPTPLPPRQAPAAVALPPLRPAMAGIRLRLPPSADLDRPVTIKGKQMPLREVTSHVDPGERLRLRNGTEVTIQEVIDAFEAFEQQTKVKWSGLVRRVQMPDTTKASFEDSRRRLRMDQEHHRAEEADGWRAVINRARGTPRAFRPTPSRLSNAESDDGDVATIESLGRAPEAIAELDEATTDVAGGAIAAAAGGRMPLALANAPPQPQREPYDKVWGHEWGHRKTAAAYVNVRAGTDFEYAQGKGANPQASCEGVVESGVWGFEHRFEAARAQARAVAGDGNLHGGIRVFIGGQSQPVWNKDGSFVLPKVERQYSTPTAKAPIPIIGPLALDLTLRATGVAMFEAAIVPDMQKGKMVSCVAKMTPSVKALGEGGAVLELMPMAKRLMDVILGSVSAGVEVNLTFFDVALPSHLGLGIHLDPKTLLPSSMDQSVGIDFTAKLMAGNVVGFVDLDLNWLSSIIAAAFGIHSGHHEREIVAWPGDTTSSRLAGVRNTILFQ